MKNYLMINGVKTEYMYSNINTNEFYNFIRKLENLITDHQKGSKKTVVENVKKRSRNSNGLPKK